MARVLGSLDPGALFAKYERALDPMALFDLSSSDPRKTGYFQTRSLEPRALREKLVTAQSEFRKVVNDFQRH